MLLVLQVPAGCSPVHQSVILTTQIDPSGKPQNESSTFTVDTPRIICSMDTKGLPAPTVVKAVWGRNDGTSLKSIKEDSLTVGNSTYLVFAIDAPSTGWAPGNYEIKLLISQGNTIQKLFTIKTDPAVNLPVINSFTLTPGSITAGQQFTLSWNVSGASHVTISPDIGNVSAGGSRLLSASSDTTYTLTAINSGGASSTSVNLSVSMPAVDKSDLVVVDVFREASMVYYKIRNNGNAISKPCSAILYVGPTKLAVDYIAPLNPGQERTEVFGTFAWSYIQNTPVTICLDLESEKGEGAGLKNCLIKVLAGVNPI